MSSVQGSIGDALAEINNLGGLGVTFTDANDVIHYYRKRCNLTTFGFLADQLDGVNSIRV